MGRVPYSQMVRRGYYRQDCSGYVSAVYGAPWDQPPGGQTTVTLVTGGFMREIPVDQLVRGDLVGRCGPDTEGDAGHVAIFDSWVNLDPSDNRFVGFEQSGAGPGPRHGIIEWLDGYRAYRWATGGSSMAGETADYACSHVKVPGGNGAVCGAHVALESIWEDVEALKNGGGITAEAVAREIIRQLRAEA